MEGKAPDSSPRRQQQQQQQQQAPGSASNLDSFFKRLGQGQSSRLWAGPGRSGAAVPGSLRTHLHSRNDAGDSSSSSSKLPPAAAPGAAAAAAAAVAAASSPRRGKGGMTVPAAAADERYGSGASGVGSAASRFNNGNSVLSNSVGGDAGAVGAGAGAGAAGGKTGASAGRYKARQTACVEACFFWERGISGDCESDLRFWYLVYVLWRGVDVGVLFACMFKRTSRESRVRSAGKLRSIRTEKQAYVP